MIILGIETSCDETALALIETRDNANVFEFRVINSLIHSQAELHSPYGGVFPNLAKREHEKNLIPLFKKILDDSQIVLSTASEKLQQISDEEFKTKISYYKETLSSKNPDLIEAISHADFLKNIQHIDRIAVTEGPGLEPALWTGIIFARIISELWNIPVNAVNHMEGHILGSLMESDTTFGTWQSLKKCEFPAVTLLISGGHTELVKVGSFGDYKIIGQTKDDAVGEAYDKAARLMKLPYPGGPQISRLAQEAIQENIISLIKLPRPVTHSKDMDFSFSGLKTAVLYAIRDEQKKIGLEEKSEEKPTQKIGDIFKKGLAREFEEAVVETLSSKLRSAIDQTGAKTIIIGGGVSANFMLRSKFKDIGDEYGIPLYMPTRHISGDNALMIALVGAMTDKTKLGKDLKADGTKRLQ